MPRIKNTSSSKTQQTFKKKKYRPWNLLDNDFDTEKKQTEYKVDITKTEDNSRTNRGQFEDKTEDIPRTYKTNRGQFEDGNEDKTEDNSRTIRGQFEDKKANFFSLSGLQKNITIHIYDVCKISRDKITKPISLEQIANSCKTTPLAAKKTIQRLEKKGIIKRNTFRSGRGGWTSYYLPNSVFQKILYLETEDNSRTIRGQFEDNSRTETRTETRTSSPSSSSSKYIYKETTTTGDPQNSNESQLQFPTEWQNLDIDPLSGIGFTITHLSQITSQNKLSPQTVQDSIYAFAFDLQENDKAKNIKGDPINFFMGILRNGKPYAPPSNYESPQDKAMRIYLERMREVEEKRINTEKEAINLSFNYWFSQLNESQKIEFLPENLRGTKVAFGKNKIIESAARTHFEAEIWPDKKQEIAKSTINPEQNAQNQIPTNIEKEVSNVETKI